MKRKLSFLGFMVLSLVLQAQSIREYYRPTPANLAARQEFQDNKFGIFLHWGLYSMLGTGEWTMQNDNLYYKEYATLASAFYPSLFNAQEWVKAFKEAGAKYICITTRHHDGFSMFETQQSDYNVVAATPFKRDIIKELAQECQRQGLRIHFYYSHLDWFREDYPIGCTGKGTGRPHPEGNWKSYYQFMNEQLTELLSHYGDVGAIWFDGHWDHPEKTFNWQLKEQYALIHRLQPACLIGNNHHLSPIEGEDFQMFERDLPGENKSGFSGQSIGALPLETCETMNGMWGYKMKDRNYKSVKALIHYLVRAAGKNANLLLNIGPQPNGKLPALSLDRLKGMGHWLRKYGETIYGTRGGFIPPRPWGVTTQKGNKLYVHILSYKDEALYLPMDKHRIQKVTAFGSPKQLHFKQDKKGALIHLGEKREEIDTILEIIYK
jgi:alpha-L-fucosidase